MWSAWSDYHRTSWCDVFTSTRGGGSLNQVLTVWWVSEVKQRYLSEGIHYNNLMLTGASRLGLHKLLQIAVSFAKGSKAKIALDHNVHAELWVVFWFVGIPISSHDLLMFCVQSCKTLIWLAIQEIVKIILRVSTRKGKSSFALLEGSYMFEILVNKVGPFLSKL